MPSEATRTPTQLIKALSDFEGATQEERMKYFLQSKEFFCTEEWASKFERFLKRESPDQVPKGVLYSHAGIGIIDPNSLSDFPEICLRCREAYWRMVLKFLPT